MGKVKITFYGALARIAGEKNVDLEASTVKEALNILTIKYGEELKKRLFDEKGKVRRFINIYINGKDIRFLKQLDTELNDNDKLSIIPAVGGG